MIVAAALIIFFIIKNNTWCYKGAMIVLKLFNSIDKNKKNAEFLNNLFLCIRNYNKKNVIGIIHTEINDKMHTMQKATA